MSTPTAVSDESMPSLEERFRAFVDATSDVVYQMSADWRVMHQLVGKSFLANTDTANRSWLEEYIPPADQPRVQVAIDEAIRDKRPFVLEHRVNRADGTLGWTSSKAIPILNKEGHIVEWFGTASDITDRREAQRAQQESEERYRTLFESIDEGFCLVELIDDEQGNAVDYRFVEVNSVFERQTGYVQARGQRASQLAPHLDQAWIDTVDAVARTGKPLRTEAFFADPARWYTITLSRLGGPSSRLVASVFDDITKRKQTEQRQAFVLQLSDALRPLTDPQEIQRVASRVLRQQLGADRVAYAELAPDEDTAWLLAEDRADSLAPFTGRSYRWSDFDPVGHQAARQGRSIHRADVEADGDLTPAQKATFAAVGFRALINVPLRKAGQLVAFIAVHWTRPHVVRLTEVGLVEEMAERTWSAVARARAEVALQQSERQLAELRHLTLLNQTEALASMGSWEYHRASGRFSWSAGMYQLTEVAPDRILSPEIYQELVIEADQPQARALISYLRTGPGHFEGQLRIRVQETIKTLRIKADVIGQDELSRVVGVDLDISEQLLAQQRIRETAESLQAVLDSSPASIGLLKAQRDERGQVVDFRLAVGNEKLAHFLIEPLSALLGQPAQRFSALLWDGQTLARLQHIFTSQEGFYEEKQLAPPQQGTWVALSVTRQDDGVVLTVLDITALKEAQAQQQHWLSELENSRYSVDALARLKTALQHRSESLRAVSHDLKSNFGIINSSISLLELAESEAEREQFVSMALRNVQQATSLLGELLDLTRLESNEQPLRISSQNVSALFEELAQNLTPLADQQGLLLRCSGPAVLAVETDALLLYRLLQNLVMNALKYTHQGQVSLCWDQEPGSGQWWFTVEDTGSGLAAHLVERLNAPVPLLAGEEAIDSTRSIGRGEPTAKESWASLRGEGIGLRIVREIVHQLEAQLVVSSEAGQGTQFRVALPLTYLMR